MEIEILINGEMKKIKIKEPKGKHQRKYFELWKKVIKNPEEAMEFMSFRDNLLLELADGQLSEDDLEEMAIVEKEKIMKAIEDRILMRQRDFLPSSSPSLSSSQ